MMTFDGFCLTNTDNGEVLMAEDSIEQAKKVLGDFEYDNSTHRIYISDVYFSERLSGSIEVNLLGFEVWNIIFKPNPKDFQYEAHQQMYDYIASCLFNRIKTAIEPKYGEGKVIVEDKLIEFTYNGISSTLRTEGAYLDVILVSGEARIPK